MNWDSARAKMGTMDLLLAERLLLISLDPRTGKTTSRPSQALHLALAGALVMDLLLLGRARLENGRVVALGPTGDLLLDQTLNRIVTDRRPRTLKHWIRALGDPRRQLLGRLVERGVLVEQPHRVLGVFPSPRHLLVQPAALQETVGPLRAALTGETPDLTPGVAALAALVSVTGLVGRVVPPECQKEARRRAKAIAQGDLGSQAVSAVLREAQAAVTASVAASAAINS